MSKLPETRSESVFDDFKPPLTADAALVESSRCLFCHDAPCVTACPTGIDIPQFIRKISTGNVRGSARTIFASNILGMSCARVCPVEVLCVGACVYNDKDEPPIAIGRLQRYATDKAFAEGWSFFSAGADTGRKVALVGGGPASLAAAHELRRHGHAVTIFEKREVLGGLNVTGVAPYKMRAEDAAAEVDWVLSIGGVELRTGVTIGVDETIDGLLSAYDAVFMGMGLGPDSLMELPGANLAGIEGAVSFIDRMKTGVVDLTGVRSAVVIGGGNTAVDAVRELRGLGVERVTMVYRGDEAGMSGYAHEWKVAKQEGATAEWRALPVAFEGAAKVRRVRCRRVDAAKAPIPGSEFTVDAELVLLAIGQSKLGAMLSRVEGVTVERGRVVVDGDGATGHARLFAAGDCANGGKEVVNAAAEGKRAANAIHRLLSGAHHG
jgi:glutamate synthase (NADPH/NADH) small chain